MLYNDYLEDNNRVIAFTTLNRLTDYDKTLRMSAVREAVKKLKEILEKEILFIYRA